MIRAAAKNHAQVGVARRPGRLPAVLDELRAGGRVGDATRRRLARKAFALTAAYDAAIVAWFDETEPDAGEPSARVRSTSRTGASRSPCATARTPTSAPRSTAPGGTGRTAAEPWWAAMTQHGGLALSYLNLYDADAAWLLVHDLAAPVRPAGGGHRQARQPVRGGGGRHAGRRLPARLRVRRALGVRRHRGPERGGRRGHGRADGGGGAGRRGHRPRATPRAPSRRCRPSARTPASSRPRRPTPDRWHLRPITGGLLVQDPHGFVADRADWRVVTQRQPTEAEMADAELAWRVCGWVKSNAIVLAKDGATWGIGAGQQNRVESGELAASKAAGRAAGGACASDAFYPFPDGIEAAAAAGVAVVIQPGGSVQRRGRTSPGPTSWAWRWSSPANATSSTDRAHRGGGACGRAGRRWSPGRRAASASPRLGPWRAGRPAARARTRVAACRRARARRSPRPAAARCLGGLPPRRLHPAGRARRARRRDRRPRPTTSTCSSTTPGCPVRRHGRSPTTATSAPCRSTTWPRWR